MRTIKLTIAYVGTRYFGWQRQHEADQPTVQGHVEAALSRALDQPTQIEGAGRTDRGVHALAQVAHFHTDNPLDTWSILRGANQHLPSDITVRAADEVPDTFHARKSATGKRYRYRVFNDDTPLPQHRETAAFEARPIVVAAMRRAAPVFVGTHDFYSLSTKAHVKSSTVRIVRELTVRRRDDEPAMIEIAIAGDGFLWNQVRTMAGTLLEVGLGVRSVEQCRELLRVRDRKPAGVNLPAHGLTLVEVEYAGTPRVHPATLTPDPIDAPAPA